VAHELGRAGLEGREHVEEQRLVQAAARLPAAEVVGNNEAAVKAEAQRRFAPGFRGRARSRLWAALALSGAGTRSRGY